MWRLLRRCVAAGQRGYLKPAVSYISDSEQVLRDVAERVAFTPQLQGVVIRHLPDEQLLERKLANWMNTPEDQVRVFYTVEGKPAYGLVTFPNVNSIKKALALNKSRFSSRKVYITEVSKFISENHPIRGGFDSRRVVVCGIDPFWTETHLMRVLKPLGDVMGLYLPRDYDFPMNMEGIGVEVNKELPERYMTFRKLSFDETEKMEDGVVRETKGDLPKSSNFLTRAYDYFSSEVTFLSNTLQSTSLKPDVCKTAVCEVYDLWCFVRAMKEQLFVRPDAEENRIDDLLNELVLKPKQEAAVDTLLQIRTHGYNFLHSFFQNRGYAYVTFATRVQAERAIACGPSITCEGTELHISFHRNEPGFLFNAGKISEAILDAVEAYGNSSDITASEKESSMITRALLPLEAEIKRQRSTLHFIGEDGDPVTAGLDPSYASAAEIQEKVEQIQAKRQRRRHASERKDLMSSDEEYFSDEEEAGRVNSTADEKMREKAMNRLFPSDPYAVASLPKLTKELPSEETVKKQIEEIQRFFKQAIPSVYKDRPQLLRVQRFGDHPHSRYVCSEPFDYSSPPAPTAFSSAGEKRRYVRSQIRHFVLTQELSKRRMPEAEDMPKPDPEQEEATIAANPDAYIVFTDSDDEKEFHSALANDPEFKSAKDNGFEEKSKEDLEERHLNFIHQSRVSFSKKIHYLGEDVEGFIKELKEKHPGILFTAEKTEMGEQYVIATLVQKHPFELKDLSYLCEKYKDQLSSGTQELDIDEEDQPLFEKFAQLTDLDPQEAAVSLVEQMTDMHILKYMDEIEPSVEEMKGLKEFMMPESIEEYRKRKREKLR